MLSPQDRVKLKALSASADGKLSATLRALIAAGSSADVERGLVKVASVKRPKKTREGSSNEYATGSN